MPKIVVCDICGKNVAEGKFYAQTRYKRHIFRVKYYICRQCANKHKELGELAGLI